MPMTLPIMVEQTPTRPSLGSLPKASDVTPRNGSVISKTLVQIPRPVHEKNLIFWPLIQTSSLVPEQALRLTPCQPSALFRLVVPAVVRVSSAAMHSGGLLEPDRALIRPPRALAIASAPPST